MRSALVFLALAACGSGPTQSPPSTAVDIPAPAPIAVSSTPISTSAPAPTGARSPALLDPPLATHAAPAVFRARFTTSKGDFVVEAHRDWSPRGADRFYDLVEIGFFDDSRFFRAIAGFMVQFGIPGDPRVAAAWREARIEDDPVRQSNTRGFVTFAQTGAPNSRTTQLFISYGDNSRLDTTRFAPFARVVEGMNVVDALNTGYGESPEQPRIQAEGNAYLDDAFPRLDRIVSARIVP